MSTAVENEDEDEARDSRCNECSRSSQPPPHAGPRRTSRPLREDLGRAPLYPVSGAT